MHLTRLKLEHFRLVEEAEFDLSPGANLFVGENAQGKTTLLEAVHLLSTGRSFRTSREREIIPRREDAEEKTDRIVKFAAAECDFTARTGSHTLRAAVTSTGKSFWIDGNGLRKVGDLWGTLNTVVFVPSDLELVQAGPAGRRALMGSMLARTSRTDLEAMQDYALALRERNALLRAQRPVPSIEFESFEEQMARHGARIMISRQTLVSAMAPIAQEQIRQLTGGADRFRMDHETGWPIDIGIKPEHLVEDAAAEQKLLDRLRYFWARDREGDKRRGSTDSGPHKADMSLVLNGQDARQYASQGQARTIVLALRLAEMQLLETMCGEPPVLLLDDVLGELDANRTRLFMQLLSRREMQTLLTATDATRIESELPVGARFKVRAGKVRKASVG